MRSKLGSALLAILISFGLWLYVITTVSPESEDTYYNIPVVLDGETVLGERGLMITGDAEAKVDLKLSGNRSDLSKVNSSNITIKVDLSKIYEPGEIHLPYSSISYPGDVASNAFVVEGKYPESLHLTIEERRTKDVPVEIKWIGSTPDGFMTDRENRILDYSSITITGPASVADQIEKAVIEVDLEGKKESISESYRYTLCNAEDEPVDAELIATNAEEVRLDVKIVRVRDLKLTYTLAEGGGADAGNTDITFNVDTIRVSGSETAMEALGDQLVVGTINLKDLPKDTTLTFTVNLPEGVTNLTGVTEVEADIKFKGLATREYTIENIESTNVPEGLKVDIITEKLAVNVRGTAADMTRLTDQDIFITVDFTGAEAGTATYKGTVTFSDGFTELGALGTVSVSATLTKK